MSRYLLLILMLFMLSCGNKKPSLAEKNPVEAADFFAAFKALKLPYHIADTSITTLPDTTTISYEVMQQFIPDSALSAIKQKANSHPVIHPVGKIQNKTELYLLTTFTWGKKTTLFTFLFNNKKKYINHLALFSNSSNDGYNYSADINSEPTFIITKDKTVKDQYSYTKKGYAYSNESKSFINVINEGNEKNMQTNEIINPIDTFPKKFKYSGNYIKDKTNFISVRDGNIPNKYTFFLHFEKNNGDCTGELKGTLTMINPTKAVFQQSGDPCVIDFTFNNNIIKVKERGSCGNHRGINCYFDDSYKKKSSPHPLKGSLKKRQ